MCARKAQPTTPDEQPPQQDEVQAYEEAGREDTTTNEFSAGPSSDTEEAAEGTAADED